MGFAAFPILPPFWEGQASVVYVSNPGGPRVTEITAVTSNILRIDLRDPPVIHRGLEAVGNPPETGAYGSWLSRNGKNVLVIGANKNWFKQEDLRPDSYVNRRACDIASNWSVNGQPVLAVYRKTQPYDWGECRGQTGAITTKSAPMRHVIYLHLSARLLAGVQTVDFPVDVGLPRQEFDYDDRVTRCSAIHHNQVGHSPRDRAKQAYLSQWIPGYGNEGRLYFDETARWHIIDQSGSIVWSSEKPLGLRIDATEQEQFSGVAPDDTLLTSTTSPPRRVVEPGYTNTSPAAIYYSGDDLMEGQIIRIEGARAKRSGVDVQAVISLPDYRVSSVRNFLVKNLDNSDQSKKKAELWVEYLDGGARKWKPWDLSVWPELWLTGGRILEVNGWVNRAATPVYDLDFSSFTPSVPGEYRIYLEGIGVSHAFRMDRDVWLDVAANMAAGEYHHRHDIALDGRFGYSRPPGFSPKSQKIYKNLTPLAFSNEVGFVGGGDQMGGIELTGLTTSPMHTDELADYAPGHHDAGDHDSRLLSHMLAYYMYIDFCDHFPERAAATNWNIPKVEELYPDEIYIGSSGLPDCLQQAMFSVHGYLKSMTPEGWVSGGVNWTSFSSLVPSWLVRSAGETTNTVFAYAPDHICTGALAMLLAKLARAVRRQRTNRALSAYYTAKALQAWAAAEIIFDNGSNWNSSSSAEVVNARQALYGRYRTECERIVPGEFDRRWALRNPSYASSGWRGAAASALFRSTGKIEFSDIFLKSELITETNGKQIALWEYANCHKPGTDVAKREACGRALASFSDRFLLSYLDGKIGFKSLKLLGAPAGFGRDGTDWQSFALPLAAAYILAERSSQGSGVKYRKAMETGWGYCLGANMTGKSLVTGLGTDTVKVALHNDSMAAGDPVPKGILVYGPCHRGAQSALATGSHSPQLWLTQGSNPVFEIDFESDRSIHPGINAWPQHEHFFESPGLIEMTEYVFGGCIGPQQYVASVLWAAGPDRT